MRVDTTPNVSITYGQLESLLIGIRYMRLMTSESRAFRHQSTDTLLLFPLFPDDARVPFHQVQMARVNSVQRGVIYEKEFDRQLLEAARQQNVATLA